MATSVKRHVSPVSSEPESWKHTSLLACQQLTVLSAEHGPILSLSQYLDLQTIPPDEGRSWHFVQGSNIRPSAEGLISSHGILPCSRIKPALAQATSHLRRQLTPRCLYPYFVSLVPPH